MDKDNQPTPNKTAYKVPDGQALAGNQGQTTDKNQPMTESRPLDYPERQKQTIDGGRQMTGADEAAVKPAETDEQFARKLENNIEEIKATDAAGRQVEENLAKQTPISEEEAKRLLTEEKRLAEIEYKNAQGKSKKTLVIVLVVAAVLCVLGGVFAIVMANRGDDEKKDDQSGVNVDQGEGKGEQKPGGDEVAELSVDDELVQRLYGNFESVSSPWEERYTFYIDENAKSGNPDKSLMMILAYDETEDTACVGEHYDVLAPEHRVTECRSGEVIRNKIKEVFGKEVTFEAGDKIGEVCGGWSYDVESDEFYPAAAGCGGMIPASVERILVRAEKHGDEIILYEKALFKVEMQFYQVGDLNSINENSKVIADLNDLGSYEDFADVEAYEEALAKRTGEILETYGETYKWTFTKNSDGNYIFSGLEKVN